MKNPSKQKGFSAVEILFFIIIIAIIAAIAVPKLIESKRRADQARQNQINAADEASAVLTLRAIFRANAAFQLNSNTGGYGTFADLTAAGLLDQTFAADGFTKSGYKFSESVSQTANSFCSTAVPVAPDADGRTFGIDSSGVIYASSDDGKNPPSCSDGSLSINGAEPLQ